MPTDDLCESCIYMSKGWVEVEKQSPYGYVYKIREQVKQCHRTLNPTYRSIRRIIKKCPYYQNRRLTQFAKKEA